jgi:hypothetical protein
MADSHSSDGELIQKIRFRASSSAHSKSKLKNPNCNLKKYKILVCVPRGSSIYALLMTITTENRDTIGGRSIYRQN